MSQHKDIWCASNDTSALYFEEKEDADKYAASCGVCSGVEVYPAPLVLSSKNEEKLKELLYCCDGLTVEYNSSNYGNAKDWLRHIAKAYSDYQEAEDEDKSK